MARRANGRRSIRDEHRERVGSGDVDTLVETSEDVATEVSGVPYPGETPSALVHETETERSDRYLKSLFWLLIAATFFEGYDGAILALVAPGIQDSFSVGESTFGIARGLIEGGLFAAFFVARLGDRVGRRKLLLWSVAGYTVFTTLTAFSWDLASFSFFQFASRVFLGAEYSVAITMIVEEFPPSRRAKALGRLLLGSAAGALVVALLLVGGAADGPLEWRTLYLVGIVPLLVLGWFRRRVKETRRFVEYRQAIDEGHAVRRISFWEPWRREFRGNLVLVGMVHLLRSLPLFGSTSWFFYYAQREVGVERAVLYITFIVAYGLGIGGYAFCGFLMERIGRRPTAIFYGLGGIIFPIVLFQSRSTGGVAVFLILAVFFGLGQAPLFGAMATELFPTYIRNAAAAWARNVFEIAGFILGPALVGILGDHYSGALGSVGDTVSVLFLLGIPGLWLLWRYLPETQGKELEDITVEVAGVAPDALVEAPSRDGDRVPRDQVRARVLLGAAVGLAAFGLVIVGYDAQGEIVRRPEGAAERFLRAVSDREEDVAERYGIPEAAGQLTGFERENDDGDWFDRIRVGRADSHDEQALVPFSFFRADTAETEIYGLLRVRELAGDAPRRWKVEAVEQMVAIQDDQAPEIARLLPGGGGPEPASASGSTWLLGIAGAVALTALVEGIIRSVGGARRQAGQRPAKPQ